MEPRRTKTETFPSTSLRNWRALQMVEMSRALGRDPWPGEGCFRSLPIATVDEDENIDPGVPSESRMAVRPDRSRGIASLGNEGHATARLNRPGAALPTDSMARTKAGRSPKCHSDGNYKCRSNLRGPKGYVKTRADLDSIAGGNSSYSPFPCTSLRGLGPPDASECVLCQGRSIGVVASRQGLKGASRLYATDSDEALDCFIRVEAASAAARKYGTAIGSSTNASCWSAPF